MVGTWAGTVTRQADATLESVSRTASLDLRADGTYQMNLDKVYAGKWQASGDYLSLEYSQVWIRDKAGRLQNDSSYHLAGCVLKIEKGGRLLRTGDLSSQPNARLIVFQKAK